MSQCLDLDDVGYAAVTVKPADGGAGVQVQIDLFALYSKQQDFARQFPNPEQEGEFMAALLDHLKRLGFPEMSFYAVDRLGAWVREQVAELSKKKSDGSTPSSPSSTTASTPST